jgi:uncharacterized protein involved in exopolysaccharide biosynthesis
MPAIGWHENERLRRENDRLLEQLAELAKRIVDLERKLALRKQNSTTTSNSTHDVTTAAQLYCAQRG